MSNWYLYYRVMCQVPPDDPRRVLIQGLLVQLRGMAVAEWPGATDQEVQDFFEYLSRNPHAFTEPEARHLAEIEGWRHNA